MIIRFSNMRKAAAVTEVTENPRMWRDRAWKEVLCDGAQSAIEYFMPDLASDMDTTKEMTGIPGVELHSGGLDSDEHMRVTDVFFDVPMRDGKSESLALFIEQQHEKHEQFALRVFETYIRLREKRRARTTGFVIYTGNAPNVETYSESCYGFEVSVKFRTFHLPSKSADELSKDERPFGRVILAGYLSLNAGDDLELREKYALEILNTTMERNYDREKSLFILKFARRIFRLKDPRISEKIKEAYNMQTIPLREYQEQVRLEHAREEGREEGREESVLEIARSMFAEGIPIEIIKKCTGLEEKDITLQ